ncbi:NUDIX hydrolase [Streptosporangium roseum]|uniref:NUDIX domain-containing protein n=1 Tax=Streptosporangium roseum TaxID=2001 RepID=UPI0004CD9D36
MFARGDTDAEDRVLLVKPNYRPGWSFPYGVVEAGEAPHDGAVREVAEELAGYRLIGIAQPGERAGMGPSRSSRLN